MIISENPRPTLQAFKRLMAETDKCLNADALTREEYYVNRGGQAVEKDVYDAINECAKGTPFQGSIQLVSGSSFPDIVANNYYGVEVKSTNKNHWVSIGSSILESTRISSVERIFLTFGKLGRPVEFKSRPYEECLSGIAVTHYPRYQIDMRLTEGETIFDKMGIPYDELRLMENPVVPVSNYYKSQLKPGESLWWTGDNVETAVPATVRLWSRVDLKERIEIVAQGFAYFPEVVAGSYANFTLWLISQKGIANSNVRDSFSAGGRVLMKTVKGIEVDMPQVFDRIKKNRSVIAEAIIGADEDLLREYWELTDVPSGVQRLRYWCQMVALKSNVDAVTAYNVLRAIFSLDD